MTRQDVCFKFSGDGKQLWLNMEMTRGRKSGEITAYMEDVLIENSGG